MAKDIVSPGVNHWFAVEAESYVKLFFFRFDSVKDEFVDAALGAVKYPSFRLKLLPTFKTLISNGIVASIFSNRAFF